MKRELVPELDDHRYEQIVARLQPVETEAIVTPRSLPARMPASPTPTDLGSAVEPHMFHALMRSMTTTVADQISQTLAEAKAFGLNFSAERLLADLQHQLTQQLTDFYLRPLVRHLRHRSEQGHLDAATPEDRYRQYCSTWWESHAQDFHASFPVLNGIHGKLCDQFINNLTELLDRIHQHHEKLATLLTGEDPLCILSLNFQGDRHNGGKTACIIDFSGGRVVYKPRSVQGEWAYCRLEEWLSTRGAGTGQAAEVIVGRGYGFMEFIQHQPVDQDDVGFLENTGELAAVLHALQANDMHFENVLARAGIPIPIDLETIMHPVDILTEDDPQPVMPGNAYQQLAMGAAASGILPSRVQRKDSDHGYIDVGFLQGESTGNPFAGLIIKHPFRDDAHVGFTRDQPTPLPDEDVEAARADKARVARAVAAGFDRRYRWIMNHREQFLDTVLKLTDGIDLRAVLQPTMRYAQLLRMLGSPEALASWDVFKTVSLRTVLFGEDRPLELSESEARSLRNLDIPFFTFNTAETDVLDGAGEQVRLRLAQTPQQMLQHKISTMSLQNLDEQLVQIWSSFVSGYPADQLPDQLQQSPQSTRSATQPHRETRALVMEMADHLVDTMRPGARRQDSWTWVAPVPGTIAHNSSWATQVLTPELYSGSLGPALALATSAELTGTTRYRDAARRVLDPVAELAMEGKADPNLLPEHRDSVFLGDAGTAWVLNQVGTWLNVNEYHQAARHLAESTLNRINSEPSITPDFLTGHVGAVSTLMGSGLNLSDHSRHHAVSVLWRHITDVTNGSMPSSWWEQSGFAHGVAASMAVVSRWLAEDNNDVDVLSSTSHSQKIQQAVQQIADRLDEFYDPAQRMWLSRNDGTGRDRTAWCHGSTGIALGLAAVQRWAPNTQLGPQRLDDAIRHGLSYGLGRNLTLCHGDLGTLESMRWVAAITGRENLAEQLRLTCAQQYTPERIRQVLADRSNRYSLTPSFMVGTSGVLYWLCHQAGPVSDQPMKLPLFPDSPEVN